MDNVHNDTNRPACPICTKTLVDNSNLKRHLRDVHGNQEKNFECSICSLKWTKIYQLNNHMKIHSGQVFKCTFDGCESKSNTQYGLNHHMKKFHGDGYKKLLERSERGEIFIDKSPEQTPPIKSLEPIVIRPTNPNEKLRTRCNLCPGIPPDQLPS